MPKAGKPRVSRTRDPEAVTRRTVTISGMELTLYDGVSTPPPKLRWVDLAEEMQVGEAIVVKRGIDRDRIASAIRKVHGNGCCVSKQRGDEIWVWRVDPNGAVVPHRNQRKRS